MTRHRIFRGLTGFIVAGHAHWFYGNLYEGVVLASTWTNPLWRSSGGMLAPGSPVRYYIPLTPLTLLAAAAATAAGWRLPGISRATLITGTAASATALGLTAHIVRNVNGRLFFDPSTPDAELETLSRRWARLNIVRLAIVGTAGAVWARLFLLWRDN